MFSVHKTTCKKFDKSQEIVFFSSWENWHALKHRIREVLSTGKYCNSNNRTCALWFSVLDSGSMESSVC